MRVTVGCNVLACSVTDTNFDRMSAYVDKLFAGRRIMSTSARTIRSMEQTITTCPQTGSIPLVADMSSLHPFLRRSM